MIGNVSTNVFEAQRFAIVDFIVIHGACLGMDWIKLHGKKISALVKRGVEELAEAIWRVLTDRELRENLIKKGYERVKQFSWEKTAKETLKVFVEVYYENMTKAKT